MLQAAERDAPASEPGKQEEIIRTTMNRTYVLFYVQPRASTDWVDWRHYI